MRMEHMDAIITRLSEIEAAAVKISEDAAQQKKEIEKEYREKTAAFNEELEKNMKERLESLREELQKKAERELAELRRETEGYLDSMEKEYEKHHEKIARGLLEKMTGE